MCVCVCVCVCVCACARARVCSPPFVASTPEEGGGQAVRATVPTALWTRIDRDFDLDWARLVGLKHGNPARTSRGGASLNWANSYAVKAFQLPVSVSGSATLIEPWRQDGRSAFLRNGARPGHAPCTVAGGRHKQRAARQGLAQPGPGRTLSCSNFEDDMTLRMCPTAPRAGTADLACRGSAARVCWKSRDAGKGLPAAGAGPDAGSGHGCARARRPPGPAPATRMARAA